jgi:tetratricopeptide (TPR) repeat protein
VHNPGNKLPEALEQIRQVLRINSNLDVAHNVLGIIYLQMGQKQKAIDEFHEALRLNPGLEMARDNLSNATGSQ